MDMSTSRTCLMVLCVIGVTSHWSYIYLTRKWTPDYLITNFNKAISKQQQLQHQSNITQTDGLIKANVHDTRPKIFTKDNQSDMCQPTSPCWIQYLHTKITLKGNIHKQMVNDLKYFQYNVQLDSFNNIHIRENYHNHLSKGGSSFQVLIDNTSQMTLCDVIDYFNGSYVAQCHLGDTCYNISVVLSYTHFVAYGNKIPPVLRRLIWNHTYCPYSVRTKPHDITTSPECSINPEGRVFWYKEQGTNWKIVVDECKVDIADFKFFNSCIKKMSSITFIGDSHSRFNYYYLLYKLGTLNTSLPRKMWGNHSTGNVFFKGVKYAKTSAQSIRETMKQFASIPGTHVVVVNGGIWDLREKGAVNFMKAFSYIKSAVIEMKRTKLRFIWMSSVAYPENIKPDGRSNPGLEALNWWVKCQLKSLGVEVFDISFIASNIRNQDNVCHHHYLCKDSETSPKVYGAVGEEIVHTLMTYICQPYTPH